MSTLTCCKSCGYQFGIYINVIEKMKEIYIKEKTKGKYSDIQPNKLELNKNLNIEYEEIFNILHINKWCCRMQIIGHIDFHRLPEFT